MYPTFLFRLCIALNYMGFDIRYRITQMSIQCIGHISLPEHSGCTTAFSNISNNEGGPYVYYLLVSHVAEKWMGMFTTRDFEG